LSFVSLIHVDSKSRLPTTSSRFVAHIRPTRSYTHSPVPLQDVDGRCFFGYSGAAKACGWFVQMLHFVSKDLVSSKYGPSLRFLGCKICTAKLLCILSILQISEQLSWASTRTLWGEKKNMDNTSGILLEGRASHTPIGTLRTR